MKTTIPFIRQAVVRHAALFFVFGALIGLAPECPRAAHAAESGAATYATPEAALAALAAAARVQEGHALRSIFGSASAEITNPDRVQATNEFVAFSAALEKAQRIVHKSGGECVIEIGPDHWPFPIPLVQQNGRWCFDTAAGKEELLNRRIGGNELAVLQVMRAYVAAQQEYARRDRDGDEVLEFAQKFGSSPGQMDGLFWPTELNGETSPLGPLVAYAQYEGYGRGKSAADAGPQPFHGYFFKMLQAQGRHAPGGKHDYLINGNMIAGFAMVAWPAAHGESGVMTFIVNQQGRVYQQDLGKQTPRVVGKLSAYDPDPAWRVSWD